jgi:hypothetical protein
MKFKRYSKIIQALCIKVATSSEFWEPNRTKFSKCNPNRTKPKTEHLNISKYKIFSNWRKIMLLLFLNIKFWEILIFVWLKVFLYWIFIFLKKFEKNFQKNVAKFLKNGFLVLSEQSTTKLKDCRKNQNQTITKCFSKFGTKPDPNRTKPKRTGTSRNFIMYTHFTICWKQYKLTLKCQLDDRNFF